MAGGVPVLLGLFIAQRWGLEELAAYTVAYSAVAVGMIVADWGGTRALPRNLAMLAPEAAAEMLAGANAFRVLIVAIMFVGGVAAAMFGVIDAQVAQYLALLFPLCPLLVMATNGVSARVVTGETRALGVAVAAGLALFAVVGAIVLARDLGPRWLVAAYVAGKCVETIVIVAKRWWVLSVSARSMRETAIALWPFSSQMILGVLYTRMAVFTVERLTTRPELGVFAVASALQNALLLIPVSLGLLHFPELTRRAQEHDSAGMRAIVVRYTITSAAGVIFGLLCLVFLSRPLGASLDVPASSYGFVLAFAALALLSIFSAISGFLMQARGQEAAAARLSVLTLSMAIAYQVAALSAWGLWGIVAAVTAAELTTIAVFGLALRRARPV